MEFIGNLSGFIIWFTRTSACISDSFLALILAPIPIVPVTPIGTGMGRGNCLRSGTIDTETAYPGHPGHYSRTERCSVFRSSATLAVYRLLYSVGIGQTVATQFDSLGLLKDRSIRTIAHPLGGWTPSTKSSNTARACFIGNLQVNVARLKPSPTASRPIMVSAH